MYNVGKANGQKKNVRKANASVILAGDQIFFSISLICHSSNQNLHKLLLTNLFRIVTAITY